MDEETSLETPQLNNQWKIQERFRFKSDSIIKIFCGKVWVIVKGKYHKKNEFLFCNDLLIGTILRTILDGEISEEGTVYKMCLVLLRPGASILYQDVSDLCLGSTEPSTLTVLRTRNKVIQPAALINT